MAPVTMIVTNTPAADLAFTYCSPLDLQAFAIPGTKLNLALIADSVTPPDDFNLTVLTLELELVKKGTKSEQVMAAGQRVSFEYHGTIYIFTVNQAVRSEESSSVERGMS